MIVAASASSPKPSPTSDSASGSSTSPTPFSNPALSNTQTSISTVTQTPSKVPSNGPYTSGSKVGFPWHGDGDLSSFVTNYTKYIYNWGVAWPDGAKQLGLEFIPMLWNSSQTNVEIFKNTVKPGYAKYALGFNEPDLGQQGNMSPELAAQVWQESMNPLSNDGYYLISPAVSGSPQGKVWMTNFFKACNNNCIIHGMSLHYYGTSAQDFISYVQDMFSTFGQPIWVTEFACEDFSGKNQQCTADQTVDFYKTTISWMEQTGYVAGYFAFGPLANMVDVNKDNQMLEDGKPNSLGLKYINVAW